jgi:hypothetical protein
MSHMVESLFQFLKHPFLKYSQNYSTDSEEFQFKDLTPTDDADSDGLYSQALLQALNNKKWQILP